MYKCTDIFFLWRAAYLTPVIFRIAVSFLSLRCATKELSVVSILDCWYYRYRSFLGFRWRVGYSRTTWRSHRLCSCRYSCLLVCTFLLCIIRFPPLILYYPPERSLCAAGEMTTWAPISGTFPHFGMPFTE